MITVALEGTTVVMFYDRVGQFTAEDFTSGVLQAWLEETYQWWYTLSPCSSTQAYTSVVNNATTTATTAVNNINTNSYDTTSQTTRTDTSVATNNTGTENTSSSTENTSSQMDSSQESSGTTTGSGSSNEAETGAGETETQTEQQESTSETTEESQQTDEQSQEESQQEETQEQETEENEESTSEEGTEEESENDDGDGEESEEEVEEEVEEEEEEEQVEKEEEEGEDTGKKKKQRKRKYAPPLISANVSAMQMVDGAFNSVTSASMTKYSYTGVESYNVGLMMWSNLKQYNLSASKSKTFFNYDRDVPIYIRDEDGKKYQFGSYKDIGSIHKVQTLSANFSSIYSSKVLTFGINDVFISNKEGFWKGFTGGVAGNMSLIKAADDFLATPSTTTIVF